MNKFRKYCPNVWVAECDEEYEKGEIIELETKYGKTVEREAFNLIAQKDGYDYSVKVIWADGGESDLSKPVEVRFTKGK